MIGRDAGGVFFKVDIPVEGSAFEVLRTLPFSASTTLQKMRVRLAVV